MSSKDKIDNKNDKSSNNNTSNNNINNNNNNNNSGSDGPDLQDRMQRVLNLLTARSRGEASNDQVENEVNQIVQAMTGKPPPPAAVVQEKKNQRNKKQHHKGKQHQTRESSSNNLNAQKINSTQSSSVKKASKTSSNKVPTLQADMDNYDDDDDDDDNSNDFYDQHHKNSNKSNKNNKLLAAKQKRKIHAVTKDNKKSKTRRNNNDCNDDNVDGNEDGNVDDDEDDDDDDLDQEEIEEYDEEYIDEIEQIPLGRYGAQMMTAFGDGRKPLPESISRALLGTRQCIQVAIRDARALRRKSTQQYQQARQALSPKGSKSQQQQQPVVDSTMMYRAMVQHDKLVYNPKCGFDIEQLRQLFPEELRAYSKWQDMHDAYQKQSQDPVMTNKSNNNDDDNNDNDNENDDTKKDDLNNNNNDDDSDLDNNNKNLDIDEHNNGYNRHASVGGHLQERAAQFDIRTEKMKKEWYIKFAKVRRGSFLPKGKRYQKQFPPTAADKQWDAKRKAGTKRGRTLDGIWDKIPAASIKFLHWVGFDPPAMPPPNDETTQALAFLAYNFMGRIVEKAIFLRNLQEIKNQNGEIDECKVLWELPPLQQLTPEDIDKSLEDPDVKLIPMYNLDDNNSKNNYQPTPQLYFGPGFEKRLEMEMEEMITSAKKNNGLSNEEKKIRQEESELFAKLAEPPTVIDSVAHIMSTHKDNDNNIDN